MHAPLENTLFTIPMLGLVVRVSILQRSCLESRADAGLKKGGGTPKQRGEISKIMIFMTYLINVRCNV